MSEVRAALEELARRSSDELCATYAHWMGSATTFCVGADSATDWLPLVKLRYRNLQHRKQIQDRAAIVWSSVDAFLVHYFRRPQNGHDVLGYAVLSVVSKEPAGYFLYRSQGAGTSPHNPPGSWRVTVPPGEARLPSTRPIAAALNEDLVRIMSQNLGPAVSPTDPDHLLHRHITTNLI